MKLHLFELHTVAIVILSAAKDLNSNSFSLLMSGCHSRATGDCFSKTISC